MLTGELGAIDGGIRIYSTDYVQTGVGTAVQNGIATGGMISNSKNPFAKQEAWLKKKKGRK